MKNTSKHSTHPTRIAVDGNEANTTHRVGSNVYAFEIIAQLEQLTRHNQQFEFTILLRQPPISELPAERAGWKYRVIGPSFMWTQWAEPIYLYIHQRKYDLLFTPGHYAPRLSPVPYISSVMDLAFLHFPDQFQQRDRIQLSRWTKYSVKRAKKVITISEFSKQDIINQYHLPPEKIEVVPPAVTQIEPASSSLVNKFFSEHRIRKPYYLFIGTLQPRKNLIRLVEAFEQLCRKISSQQLQPRQQGKQDSPLPQLIIAGKIGWLASDIIDRIQHSPFFDYIVLPGYVPENIKPALYQQALASVLVGLYEGFGIPPLESLEYDCIPIVSNGSSLPEVVGQAGILVDPLDVSSISTGMEQIYNMTNQQRSAYLQHGADQLQQFSWQQSAEQVLECLAQTAVETGN